MPTKTLDPQNLPLRFTFGAALAFEEETGENIFSAFIANENAEKMAQNISFPKLARMLWAGCLEEHPGLSYDNFKTEVLNGLSIKDGFNQLFAALKESMPTGDEFNEEDDQSDQASFEEKARVV